MTRHTDRGAIPSVYQDDGFGNLERISFSALIARIAAGWREL